MAKNTSLIQLNGTLDGLTYVNSKTYGHHLRKPRGTYKKAELNESFSEQKRCLVTGVQAARLIHQELNAYRDGLKGGQFWQRIVGYFQQQVKENGGFRLDGLTGQEVHTDYRLSRFCAFSLQTERSAERLHIHMRLACWPYFEPQYITGFRVQLIGVFPDFAANICTSYAVFSPLTALPVRGLEHETPMPEWTFSLPGTVEAGKPYLFCVKMEGAEKEKVPGSAVTKGMCIAQAGLLTV